MGLKKIYFIKKIVPSQRPAMAPLRSFPRQMLSWPNDRTGPAYRLHPNCRVSAFPAHNFPVLLLLPVVQSKRGESAIHPSYETSGSSLELDINDWWLLFFSWKGKVVVVTISVFLGKGNLSNPKHQPVPTFVWLAEKDLVSSPYGHQCKLLRVLQTLENSCGNRYKRGTPTMGWNEWFRMTQHILE